MKSHIKVCFFDEHKNMSSKLSKPLEFGKMIDIYSIKQYFKNYWIEMNHEVVTLSV